MYLPAAAAGTALAAGDRAGARQLTAWKARVRAAWPGVSVQQAGEVTPVLSRTSRLKMRVAVNLNGLEPGEVAVEFIATRRLPRGNTDNPVLSSYGAPTPDHRWQASLQPVGTNNGATIYECTMTPPASGQYSMEIHVRPSHPLLTHPLELGLLKTL
jgi:starch phosphorylase